MQVEQKVRCKVCHDVVNDTGHYDRDRLLNVGICSNCDFWVEKWQMRKDPKVARINGEHYIIGSQLDDYKFSDKDSLESIIDQYDSKLKVKGMSGNKTCIIFFDGRVAITDDLWHQGTIPAHFKQSMPNNASFLERSK